MTVLIYKKGGVIPPFFGRKPIKAYICFKLDVAFDFDANCCTIIHKNIRARITYSEHWLPLLLELLKRPTLIEQLEKIAGTLQGDVIASMLSHLEARGFILRIEASNEETANYILQNKRESTKQCFASIPEPLHERTLLDLPNLGQFSLKRSLGNRYSSSTASGMQLSLDNVSLLLSLTYGFYVSPKGHKCRTVPAAGGLFPLSVYLSLNDGGCLKSFLYHPEDHSIELFSVCQGSIRALCNDQETATDAIGLVTYIYNVQKNSPKYGARGLQFALIECGHAAQNLILAASDIGLGTRCIGAVDFEAASPAFNLLSDQMPIYAVALY